MSSKYFRPLFWLALYGVSLSPAKAQNIPDMNATGPAGTAINYPVPSTLSSTIYPSWNKIYIPQKQESNPDNINDYGNPEDVKITTTYNDGFGRPVQTVQNYMVSGAKPHLVTPYDSRFVQVPKSYMTYAAADANYHNDLFTRQKNYYNALFPAEQYTCFSGSEDISSTTQRGIKQMAPGLSQVGQGRGAIKKIVTNAASEIKIWEPDINGKPEYKGTYPPGSLAGEVIEDPSGAAMTIFRDFNSRVICKVIKESEQNVGGGGVVVTYNRIYFVYDKMDRLVCTMPPKACAASATSVSQDIFDNLCFHYKYDNKGRLASQHFPGEQGYTEVVYDLQDRVVMRRSPNDAAKGQWQVMFYDRQSRVKATSLLTDNSSRASWQNIMDGGSGSTNPSDITYYLLTIQGQSTYPQEQAIPGNYMLSYSYYDDYSQIDPNDTIWEACINTVSFNEALTSPGTETPLRGMQQHGYLTGSKVRIMPSPGADTAQTGDWRVAVSYYDGKGREIYTANLDLYHGAPIHQHYSALQYDFRDRFACTKHVMKNANGTTQQHTELTRFEYDNLTGRLQKSWRKTDTSNWVVQTTLVNNEQGKVQRKILGNYGEVQDYTYNIRGQLNGINDHYTRTGDAQGESKSFGQVLSYDYGFSQPRYDGKIGGMIWRGAGGSLASAYGYNYDLCGRLTTADYRRYEPPSGSYFAYEWRKDLADYSVSNLQYDKDGNILTMRQKGVQPGGAIVTMDQLAYTYANAGNSSRLLKVYDTAANYNIGDFVNTNANNDDYSYDANGNLVADNNKNISSVTYNHLDKPVVVTFSGGIPKRIEYSYDATGKKIQELTVLSGTQRQIDYVGNYVYENNEVQYITTPEGRSVYDDGLNRFIEQYFVKDYLENIRSVVAVYVPPVLEYLGTYEVASANLEGLFFEHHNEVRDDKPGGVPGDNQAGNLNGADPERRIGTSMLLKVMADDKIEMNVNNYYETYQSEYDDPVTPEDMLGTLVTTLTEGTGGFIGSENHNIKTVTDVFNTGNYEVFNELVSQVTDNNRPKAYLNYVMFNEDMEIMPEMSGAFQADGEGGWTGIGTTTPLVMPRNGYLAIYLSNTSSNSSDAELGNVYFDQLVIRFSRGKLKEEAHYYPHGLPIAGMGSTANGYVENRAKYQSNDYNKALGLNWMNFNARQYDPQIARFLGVDPKADASGQEEWSPFAAMANDPVNIIDPDGEVIIIREVTYVNKQTHYESAIYKNGHLFNMDGTPYEGNNAYILARAGELNTLRNNDPRFEAVISDLEKHQLNGRDVTHIISNMVTENMAEFYKKDGTFHSNIYAQTHTFGSGLQRVYDPYKNVIKFVPDIDRKEFEYTKDFSNQQILIHELKHDWNDSYGGGLKSDWEIVSASNPDFSHTFEEIDASNFQSIQRKIEGLTPRIRYGKEFINKAYLVDPDKYQIVVRKP